jgi:hypothetical protein
MMACDIPALEFGEIERVEESLPQLVPVSDCSAASSEYGGHGPLESEVEVSIPEVLKDFSGVEVGYSSSCQEPEVKHVAFGSLEIRCYPVILGDHPECAMGPPVGA